jgi:hypothetical protein
MSKLGIFYTDNAFPKIISLSLEKLKLSSTEIRIVTCVNEHIENNPFEQLIVNNPIRNHYNIIEKILKGITYAKTTGEYKYVSFLEHDVLYPEGYFNYPDFKDAIINDNYIGMCSKGFQKKLPCQHPLHQLTMTIDFALNHFNSILKPSKTQGVIVEPIVDNHYSAINPAIHINHGMNFTSHFNCYDKNYMLTNDYWNDYSDLWSKL